MDFSKGRITMSADLVTSMSDTPPAEAPQYPMLRATGCPFDPPPFLRTLQADAPITRVRLWDGSAPWLISRYDDQRVLLSDPRISADAAHPHYPYATTGQKEIKKEVRTFVNMDDPEHARLRRMVTPPRSPLFRPLDSHRSIAKPSLTLRPRPAAATR
jgi:cytochrome P450